ncbi:MAG TPA: enolase C-terminal domain-like protein [Planctomycetaceae bacterium]|nr:enolase C-terminal domain-like protein [Planctomycetaceae bacterium]
MRIVEIVCRHVRIPLKRRIKHASHERNSTDSLVVSCRLDDGSVGWGEGLPREYVTGDTVEADLELFEQTAWRECVSQSLDSLDDAVARCQSIRFDPPGESARDSFGNPLKCAIELSLLDAVLRSGGLSFSDLTKIVVPNSPQPAPSLRYSGAITATIPGRVKWLARYYRWTGFEHCKIKVGVAGTDDVELLKLVRKHIGPQMKLRIDANEAWTCDNLKAKTASLVPFDLVALEQPVPHSQIGCLSELRPGLGIPIMLDESLCSLTDAERAVDEGLCDYFNIRLSKCGGYLNSVRLAEMSRKAGLGFQLGCQVGETGILSAAGRHFATNVPGWIAAEGSFDHYLVKERLTKQDLTFEAGGKARSLPGPGLGVSIDERAVKRVTVESRSATF